MAILNQVPDWYLGLLQEGQLGLKGGKGISKWLKEFNSMGARVNNY